MNEYTLITSIGTGMYKTNDNGESGYQPTTYLFRDGKKYSTNLFYEAILNSRFKPVKKIIFVGTYTSSWDVLIKKDKNENLWSNVLNCVNTTGLQPESELIPEIKNHVRENHSVEIELIIHTNKVDFDTTEEIFKIYNSIIPLVEKDTNILFDITHGFRTMPILMYQALQFASNGKAELKNIELIYGEYVNTGTSQVRDLSNYWHYARITDAISVFKAKLDGFALANLLGKEFSSYSKVINKISNIVQTNFCLQITEVLKQLKNTLSENYEKTPFWFNDIKSFLTEFYKQIFSSKCDAETIYNFAKYLRKKNLNTQAIISLQLAVETACAEKSDNPEKNKGNYDFWKEEGKKIRDSVTEHDKKIKDKLKILENFRNQIAHGGARNKARNKEIGSFPMAENFPNIFDSASDGVRKFLDELKKAKS